MGIWDSFKRGFRKGKAGSANNAAANNQQAASNQQNDNSMDNQNSQRSVPTYITNVIKGPSKGYLWLIILLFVIVIGILWYKSALRPVLIWLLTYGGLMALCGFILWGLLDGIKESAQGKPDGLTKLFISLALVIWLVDMIPPNFPVIGRWLGQPYAGFEISSSGLLNISLVPVITSSFMFIWLYINMVKNIVKHEYVSFGLGFISILIINNFIKRFFPTSANWGFSIYLPTWQGIWAILYYVGIAALFVGLIILAIYFDRKKSQEFPGFFSYFFMITVFSFFWINNGWQQNPRAVLHAIFIIAFGFGYIKTHEENPVVWHILIPLLLIVDFYGYGLLWNLGYLWAKFIPIFIVFVISYCYHKTNSGFAILTFIVLVTVILILSLDVTAYAESGAFDYKAQSGGADFTQFFGTLSKNTKLLIERQLVFATGGLYRSQVELNQYAPLGVFFKNIRAAQPKFYDDEPVTIWATISARTLSEPVNVSFKCYRKSGNERIEELQNQASQSGKFEVSTYEERDVECNFQQSPNLKKFEVGSSNNIILSLTYNFATSAYQKMYFIDRDRLRALTRENIDPLKQYGITDLSSSSSLDDTSSGPAAVYTNGPVEVATQVQKLVPVDKEPTAVASVLLGILLQNRNQISDKNGQPIGEWEGKINKINQLAVILPPGITIPHFDPSNPNSVKNCNPINFKEYSKTDCISECINLDVEGKKKCENECTSLFRDDSSGRDTYTGYQLDVSQIRNNTEVRDIDRYKTFTCRLTVSKDVLDNTPITTKFIRIRAKYDYLIEKSYDVVVEKAPIPYDEYGPSETGYTPFGDEGTDQRNEPDVAATDTEIDAYLTYKKSPLQGIGQCMENAKNRTKVPTAVMVSVALLESKKPKTTGFGTLSDLATQSKNLFGVKCTPNWITKKCPTPNEGDKCCRTYDKSDLDKKYEPNAPNNYRIYVSRCASVNDFADIISKESRYRSAMGSTNDPETMITKIGAAGYASDTEWATKIKLMYRDLQKYLSTRSITAQT
ncbi:MAG TPA: glucosaminidase domain-containing protein [Candidatus Nanoarchaeia archaeon]|nr:glucosaminidase domain-containing protein [Candidatus Nanoarchaeia archaeon]